MLFGRVPSFPTSARSKFKSTHRNTQHNTQHGGHNRSENFSVLSLPDMNVVCASVASVAKAQSFPPDEPKATIATCPRASEVDVALEPAATLGPSFLPRAALPRPQAARRAAELDSPRQAMPSHASHATPRHARHASHALPTQAMPRHATQAMPRHAKHTTHTIINFHNSHVGPGRFFSNPLYRLSHGPPPPLGDVNTRGLSSGA